VWEVSGFGEKTREVASGRKRRYDAVLEETSVNSPKEGKILPKRVGKDRRIFEKKRKTSPEIPLIGKKRNRVLSCMIRKNGQNESVGGARTERSGKTRFP